MGKTFNTGYLQNIIQYDGSNNIILPSLIGTGTRIVVTAANGTLSSQTASTTNIAEGTNLYYTDTRVGTYLSANTYATQSYVTTAIANLVDASPATLDTLNELAAALGDDPNFATTVATSIGTKQAQLNGTGFVKVSGTTVSYDNSTYLTTSSASSTYVPYTGASADLVLGANNFSSKRVSVLKSSDGYGGFTSNYLFLQTGSSTTNVGVDGISLLSKPNTRALVINYDIGGTNYGATLDAALLTGGRTFEFPNASGVLALTSNIPTNNNQLTNGAGYITSSALSPYLLLAGGIMSGNISYGVGNGVAWYLQPQAVGGGPSNGPVLRLKSHSGAGALSDRSGALAWIDGNGVRLDVFEWNSSLINAYVPINGTSAVFSSTVNINSTLYVASTATIAYNGLSGDFGAGYTTGLGVGYSSTVGKGINMGWNTTLDSGFIGSVHNGTGWKSLILSPIGGAVYIGATGSNDFYAGTATFSSSVSATSLTIGTTGGSTISITTSNNAGTTGTPLQTKINFLGYNGNINGQIRVDDISSTAQVGSMKFYTWNSAQVLALTLAHTGAATFNGIVDTVGLLTGQASIYQSDPGGLIASNRWGVYNGGATNMTFLYNPSGQVIFDNGSPKLTLSNTGAATFSSTLQANGGNITSFSGVGVAGFGNGINIHTQAGTYTTGHGGILQFQNEDVITGGIRAIRDGGSWGGALLFYTHNTSAGNTFNTTFVEGMRLTSNGNLLLGTVSDGVYRLDVQQGASNAAKFNFAVTGVWGGGANQDHGMLISGARHTSDTNTSLLHILNNDATSLFRVTDYGKVGINIFTPTATLDINGDVRYRGSIYDSFNFVASGNYTNGTYYNIVGVNIIPTGIYIIEGLVDTFAAGGGIYFMRFASVPFFMWDVGSNSTTFVDLPPVLGTGHHLGNQFPSFRLQQTLAGAGIHLQFTPNSTWAGIDNSGGKAFRVNLKRIG